MTVEDMAVTLISSETERRLRYLLFWESEGYTLCKEIHLGLHNLCILYINL